MSLLATISAQLATPAVKIAHGLAGPNDEIAFDVALSQSPVFTNTITEHPIEDGSKITDHIYPDPDVITLQGIITDSPVRYFSGIRDIIDQGFGAETRSKSAFDILKQIRDEAALVTVTTNLEVYENMAVRRFSPTRTPTTGHALEFEIELVKVNIIASEIVKVTPDKVNDKPVGTKDQVASKVDTGKQPALDPDTVTQEKTGTFFDLMRGLGLL